MDFQNNIVLKENYSFLVADADGAVRGGEKGLYDRDTRFLARYAWDPGEGFQTLVLHTPRPDTLYERRGRLRGHGQEVGVERELALAAKRLSDTVTVENTSMQPQELTLRLELAADFVDLFEVRGWFDHPRETPTRAVTETGVAYRYRAADGIEQGVEVRFSCPPERFDGETAVFALALEPGERWQVEVETLLHNPVDEERPGPDYDAWRASFADLTEGAGTPALRQAVDDLRSLLLFTEAGPVLAAGIPWFVATFGRDALLAAHLLLPYRPDVAEGTLRYLAQLQAHADDRFRAAQPGKIPHEMRFGELARTGEVPHAPYYGTVDATALFVMLLGALVGARGSDALVAELAPAWQAALDWMTGAADPDGDGFLEFISAPTHSGTGLSVQSWKDSGDSMAHADGSLATGAIAVSEVQGYAYAAFRAAADFHRRLGNGDEAGRWRDRAQRLKERFHAAFWLDDLGTYAMALDGAKRPLAVKSSDAGQLLWTGIVPTEAADRLVTTLFDDDSFSGWGFRTLGARERRYNPVSYHNGSVWPHDTALIAAGLERYGFHDEARRVARAVLELADGQPDRRLPELVAGYPRRQAPPVPYPVACRPQAWDAAAAVYLARLLAG
ncbi:MAG: glycogen debranching N-terminal domain-containing protein [Deinococcales bacterium]